MPAKKTEVPQQTSLQDLQQRIAEDPWGVFVACEALLRQAADTALEALGDIEGKLAESFSEGDEETADLVLQMLRQEADGGDEVESFEAAMIAIEERQALYRPLSSQPGSKPKKKAPPPKKKKSPAKEEKPAKKPAPATPKKAAAKQQQQQQPPPDEIEKGSRVRIIKGKQGLGVEGEVFWWGDSKFGDNMRAGVRGDDGETYWVDDWALELA